MLKSVCTIANIDMCNELIIMLRSIDQFNLLDLHVACDVRTQQALKSLKLKCPLHIYPIISDSLRGTRSGDPRWPSLMACKTDIMGIAINKSGDTLYSDSDMIFLNPIADIDLFKYDVALSRHLIMPDHERRYGIYNGGYVASSRRDFPDWWKRSVKKSRYYDQQCLDNTQDVFNTQQIPATHNYGWWRINQTGSNEERKRRLASFAVKGDMILYEDSPLVSIHTHVKNPHEQYAVTNKLARKLLGQSSDPRHKFILSIL